MAQLLAVALLALLGWHLVRRRRAAVRPGDAPWQGWLTPAAVTMDWSGFVAAAEAAGLRTRPVLLGQDLAGGSTRFHVRLGSARDVARLFLGDVIRWAEDDPGYDMVRDSA